MSNIEYESYKETGIIKYQIISYPFFFLHNKYIMLYKSKMYFFWVPILWKIFDEITKNTNQLQSESAGFVYKTLRLKFLTVTEKYRLKLQTHDIMFIKENIQKYKMRVI